MNTPPPRQQRASQRVILVCVSCPNVWEPHRGEWATGRTACPECGGWIMTAVLDEPLTGISPRLPRARPG